MKITEYSPSNPQGKGHVGLLVDWDYTQPRGTIAKTAGQLLTAYFTSMLVLSANFKFKPVVGQEYYLYWMNEQCSMSLIAPSQWSRERRNSYVGKCELHADMTWTMNPAENLLAGHDQVIENIIAVNNANTHVLSIVMWAVQAI